MGFSAPSRMVLVTGEHRLAVYVTNFETDTIWLIASHDVSFLKAKGPVRLIVRAPDGPSLGLGGRLSWVARDRIAVAMEDPVDRAIVAAWQLGDAVELDDIGALRDRLVFDTGTGSGDVLSSSRPPDSNWFGITLDDSPS